MSLLTVKSYPLTMLDRLFALLERFYRHIFVFVFVVCVTGVSVCISVFGTITHSLCICLLAIKLRINYSLNICALFENVA